MLYYIYVTLEWCFLISSPDTWL